MMTLGAFALETQVGGGGHGLVWRGRHLGSGLPVAIKLLPPTADRIALHGLKNEVQAVARLHHPHIVAILDTGIVDAAAVVDAARVGQTLLQDSPWVAYELASGLWRGNLVEEDLAIVAGGAGEAMRAIDAGRADRALAFARAQRQALTH